MGNILKKKNTKRNAEKDEDNESFLEVFLDEPHAADKSVAERLSEHDPHIKSLIAGWQEEQLKLKQENILSEDENFLSELKYIGGIDISFPSNKDDLVHACACLVVLSYPDLEIVYKNLKMVHLTSTYIPQYLAFREAEPFKDLCDQLLKDEPHFYPQLILLDGNGILHPQKFGIACHFGVKLGLPTIGVAKKLFHVDGLEKNGDFKSKVKSLGRKGDTLELTGESGFVYGKALRSTETSTNPIYVSVGHKVCLETAVDIVAACCKVRVPEPIRWADILSREYIREHYSEHAESCTAYEELNTYFLKLSKFN